MTTVESLGFDPDALREKYRQERERRLRDDGIDQYVEITGDFADFARDPWALPGFTREPLTDLVDVVIIGAGFGGLLTGARLRELGVEDIRLIEKGGRRRRHLVLEPLSGHRLRRRVLRLPAVARGDRLHPHREVRQGRRDPRALPADRPSTTTSTATPVSRPRSSRSPGTPSDSRWVITTNRGDAMRARFVGHGQRVPPEAEAARDPRHRGLSRATRSTPAVGTTRTPAATPSGNLDRVADKRVGIIGTGATAVQCVPHLGASGPSTSTSSSARRRRSTCGPTDRPTRSGRRRLATRLASPPDRELSDPHRRWRRRGGPRRRRLDEHHRGSCWPCASTTRRVSPTRSWLRRWSWPTSPRWRRSGPGSTPWSRTRQPPRRSSPGTASSASARASTTSTCRPSTCPT